MKKHFTFWQSVSALVFSAALTMVTDLFFAFLGKPLPLPLMAFVFLIPAVLLLLFRIKTRWFWAFGLFALVVAAGIYGGLLYHFRSEAASQVRDSGKEQLYAGQRVLVLVPHQDDEILVAGGVMEEYVKYGSEVYLAFYTNGDYSKPRETRLTEALAVAADLGIPEERVIFLGYGDNMGAGPHIYNMLPGQQAYASPGHTATCALESHPPYRESSYLRENVVADMKTLVLELRPDVILCTEFEEHPDHAALSLFFDEVMAEILRQEDNDYFPLLLKSSCYATAFFSVSDFYGGNLLSTVEPSEEHFAGVYDWEERIRLPLNGSGLSHSLYGCDAYRQLRLHRSQKIASRSEMAINGDRIFWLRDTGSLSYQAELSVSSGDASLLSDFKLLDNPDVEYNPLVIDGCTWVPDAGDEETRVTVTLKESGPLQRICLYDNPDPDSNVLQARIVFDDGSSLQTGPLNPRGSATTLVVGKAEVKSFSVELLKTEGDAAGLTEIEAYAAQRDYGLDFLKLQDLQGNFVYDYYINESGKQSFEVYASGVEGPWQLSCDNPRCSAVPEGNRITIKCPKGEHCTITVATEDGRFADSVHISNPGRFLRETGPALELQLRRFFNGNMHQSNSYQLLRAAYHWIRTLT